MGKKSGKSQTRMPRRDWQVVSAPSESLRFVEAAGFVSLEECEQELFDPANPPPIFISDVAEDRDDADGDDGGRTQLEQAQAEVDRLIKLHATRSPDEAVANRAAEDAEATRIPRPSKASRDKAAKRKRVEPEQDAEAARSPHSEPAKTADVEVDGGDGDGVAAPARKKRTRQKKRKKKAVKKIGAEASGGASGGGVPEEGQAAGETATAPNAPDAAARERGGASGRDLSDGECAAAALNWERLGLHPSLVIGLVAQGFGAPTPIQEAALPAALHGMRDLVGAAQTGSGKTLAFGLPILHRLMEEAEAEAMGAGWEGGSGGAGAAAVGAGSGGTSQPAHPAASRGLRGGSLFALIMTPTRELAVQVTAHLQAVAASCPLLGKDCIISLVGGLSLDKQRRQLAGRPRVVVATPGRLWELIREGCSHLQALPGVRFFVLDEVDRMIEAGHFQELSRILEMLDQPPPPSQHASQPDPADESQQEAILGPSLPPSVPPGRRRQTILMSATLMLPPAAREAHAKKVKNHQPLPQVRPPAC
jgi:ATP-dependent RNA helicase DDX24/MAK5